MFNLEMYENCEDLGRLRVTADNFQRRTGSGSLSLEHSYIVHDQHALASFLVCERQLTFRSKKHQLHGENGNWLMPFEQIAIPQNLGWRLPLRILGKC